MNHIVTEFEHHEVNGRLHVLCYVARHLETGATWKVWVEGTEPSAPPFPLGPETVVIAHTIAAAEGRDFLAMGWPFPGGWIDTMVEEKILARGAKPEGGFGLLACCRRRGVPVMPDYRKADMQALCLRGGHYSESERKEILDYCEQDVEATWRLFEAIRDKLCLSQSVFRGLYSAECSRIAERGLPVDMSRFKALKQLGNDGLRKLFAERFDDHGIIQGGKLNRERFTRLVETTTFGWPVTDTGEYATDKDTLKEFAKLYGGPWLGIRQLLHVIRSFNVDALVERGDGRLYADLKPHGTITGRSTPSTSQFLWNLPKWSRSLVQPHFGRCILQLDWKGHELGIAIALSEDERMRNDYLTGDPYEAQARRAGAIARGCPPDEVRLIRNRFKQVSLGVLMGMTEYGIAKRLNIDVQRARAHLELHKRDYPPFWGWSDAVVSTAAAHRPLETAFGLRYQPGREFKPRTARNFLLQGTGSDMLRVVVLLLARAGIIVIATMHDAVLVECAKKDAREVRRIAVACMNEASRITLWDRLTIDVDVGGVTHPHHYRDKDGLPLWCRLASILNLPLDKHEI